MGERVVLDFQMFFECFNTFHRMARWHALGKPFVHKWVNVTLSNWFAGFVMCDLSSTSIFAAWALLFFFRVWFVCSTSINQRPSMLICSESPSPGCGFFRAYIQTFEIRFFCPFPRFENRASLFELWGVLNRSDHLITGTGTEDHSRTFMIFWCTIKITKAPTAPGSLCLESAWVRSTWKRHSRCPGVFFHGPLNVFLPSIRQTFAPGEPGYLVFHDVFFDVA